MRLRTLLFGFLLLLLSWHSSQAQLRIFAGPQMSSAKYTIRNARQATEFKQGFMAGVGFMSMIEGPLYFAPSFYYSQKGYKVTFDRPSFPPDSAAKNNNTTINTIVIAPHLQLNFSPAKNHLFVRFGPSIDIAVSGKETFDSTANKHVSRNMNFSSVGYSIATASATVQLGYELKNGLSIFAHYEHGLSSLNNADLGPIILHRIVGLSVGWNLGRK